MDVTLPADWQTPAVDPFRSRGGDRKGEMGLDQQVRFGENWATPRSAADRTSAGALNRDHFAAPSLGQQVELSDGVLPREFSCEADLTPAARRIYEEAVADRCGQTPRACDGEKGSPNQKFGNGLPSLASQVAHDRPESDTVSLASLADHLISIAGPLAGTPRDWPTPTAADGKSALQYTRGNPSLTGAVNAALNEPRQDNTDDPIDWPTPCAADGTGGKIRAGMSPTGQMPDGSKATVSLNQAVREWPTPAARDYKDSTNQTQRGGKHGHEGLAQAVHADQANWSTPTARDGMGGPGHQGRMGGPNLRTQIADWATPAASWTDGRGSVSPEVWAERQVARIAEGKAPFADPLHIQVEADEEGPLDQPTLLELSEADLAELDTALERAPSSPLSPFWVATLQGMPRGWMEMASVPDADRIKAATAPDWPARPGQAQYDWEPARTQRGIKGRAKMLKALGNLCVPAQAFVVFDAIRQVEEAQDAR